MRAHDHDHRAHHDEAERRTERHVPPIVVVLVAAAVLAGLVALRFLDPAAMH